MKNAEEWRAQLDLPNIREVVLLPWDRWIKAIQLDAERSGYERGVREAAEVVVKAQHKYRVQFCVTWDKLQDYETPYDAILTRFNAMNKEQP